MSVAMNWFATVYPQMVEIGFYFDAPIDFILRLGEH